MPEAQELRRQARVGTRRDELFITNIGTLSPKAFKFLCVLGRKSFNTIESSAEKETMSQSISRNLVYAAILLGIWVGTGCTMSPYGKSQSLQFRLPDEVRRELSRIGQWELQSHARRGVPPLSSSVYGLENPTGISSEWGLSDSSICWGVAVLPADSQSVDACSNRGIFSAVVPLSEEGVSLAVPAGGGWNLAVYLVTDPSGQCAQSTAGLRQWQSRIPLDVQNRLAFFFKYQTEFETDGGYSAGVRPLNSADYTALQYSMIRVAHQEMDVFADQTLEVGVSNSDFDLQSPVCLDLLAESAEVLAIEMEESDSDLELYSWQEPQTIQAQIPVPSSTYKPHVNCRPLVFSDLTGPREVLWTSLDDTSFIVWSATYQSASGSWSAPTERYSYLLNQAVGETFGCLRGAMNSVGQAVILWSYAGANPVSVLKSLSFDGSTWGGVPQVVMGSNAAEGNCWVSDQDYGVVLNDLGEGTVIARSLDLNSNAKLCTRNLAWSNAGQAGSGSPTWVGSVGSVSGGELTSGQGSYSTFQVSPYSRSGLGIVFGGLWRDKSLGYYVPIKAGEGANCLVLREFGEDVNSCGRIQSYLGIDGIVDSIGSAHLIYTQTYDATLGGGCTGGGWDTGASLSQYRVVKNSVPLSNWSDDCATQPAPPSGAEALHYPTAWASFRPVLAASEDSEGNDVRVGAAWVEGGSVGTEQITLVKLARWEAASASQVELAEMPINGQTWQARAAISMDPTGNLLLAVSQSSEHPLYGAYWLADQTAPADFSDQIASSQLDGLPGGEGLNFSWSRSPLSLSHDSEGRALLVWIEQLVGGASYSLGSRAFR